MKKKVYVAMSADLIHPGHLNIIKEAKKLGNVTIGLLTDKAISSYKRVPFMEYKDRYNIISQIKGVTNVIPQHTHDYVPNLLKLKPNFVVHGDDWKNGVQKKVRDGVVKVLKKWKGKLIEPKYSEGFSSTKLIKSINEFGTTPDIRRKQLKRNLNSKNCLRFLDVHNALSGIIVENTKINKNHITKQFDGMWASSLTSSTAKGKPDIELVDFSERMQTINEILEVTTKPIIYDADTGGKIEHFVFTVKTLERLGVSAVIIEDKIGLKKNSLFGTEVFQQQDTIGNFKRKISEGKKALATEDFMIIARIESLILNKGVSDAIKRAKNYISAGADGIMIHSRKKNFQEISKFCKIYNKFKNRKPLVIVPSSFSIVKENRLEKAGANIIIYANHLLRAVYPSMTNTAKSILLNSRAYEIDKKIMSIKDILNLIPGTK